MRTPVAAKPGGSAPAKTQNASDGRTHVLAGETLFEQGDPGGDLFFIEEGTVEIFQYQNGQDITLAEMGQGEIIGVMTCLTSKPRMASARAKTDVTCKKVPAASVAQVLRKLPKWLKIVIKEFTIRLAEMNKNYSDATLMIRKLRGTQISNLYTGTQLASTMASLAPLLAFSVEETQFVLVEDLLEKSSEVLNLERPDIDRLYNVLLKSGLLREEVEPDKKQRVIRLEVAQKVSHFVQFVKDSKHGPSKKLVRARFSHKETRVMAALVKYAMRLKMDLEQECRLEIPNLHKALEKSTGVKFEREALAKGESLKLLHVEDQEGQAPAVVTRPGPLGRSVACVDAVRRLSQMDDKDLEAQTEEEDQAA